MRIAKLLPSARIQGRWLCHLEDGTILRVTGNEVACFGLYSGMELTEETKVKLEEAVRRGEVLERALRLLSGRPMSRKELVDKLTARPRDKEKEPIPEELAEEAANRLEELGYLNDAEYARTVARHYAAKGYGERKLRDELWKRGVPRAYWDQALEEVQDPTDAMDEFIRRKLMGRTADRETLGKLSAALARRGYRWEDIRTALSRYGETFEDESI